MVSKWNLYYSTYYHKKADNFIGNAFTGYYPRFINGNGHIIMGEKRWKGFIQWKNCTGRVNSRCTVTILNFHETHGLLLSFCSFKDSWTMCFSVFFSILFYHFLLSDVHVFFFEQIHFFRTMSLCPFLPEMSLNASFS